MSIYNGKIILVTGGTGSFGTALVDRLLETDIKEIRILSRDEKKQDDMRNLYHNDKLKFYIGDVRDYQSIEAAFNKVDYVFHAAALKQVPSCEFFPLEAMKTNVIGSNNVIDACIAHHVPRAVFLSTDKSVMPINTLGMTKGLMEKNVIARSRQLSIDQTILSIARYGNVMGTRGSVIPLFTSQIKNKQPLTITNPDMTRFMMSIDDAIDLVSQCFEHAKQGEIFVHKAPAITIDNLAKAMIELYGSHAKIHCIGVRHGEKIHEMLLTSEEMARSVDLGAYFRIVPDKRDLNYDLYFKDGIQRSALPDPFTSENTHMLTIEEMKVLLGKVGLVSK